MSDKIFRFQENGAFADPVVPLTDRLPVLLAYPAAAWSSGRIYVFGGKNASSDGTNRIYEITPSNTPGNQIATLPETLPQMIHAATAVADHTTGKIYILGGRDFFNPVRTILEFDPMRPQGSRLRTLPVMLPGEGKAWMAGAFHTGENAIYLFGGSGYSNEILKLVPSTGQVQVLSDRLPVGMLATSAVFDSGHSAFLLFGGDAQPGPSDAIYRYTPGSAPVLAGRFDFARSSTSAVFIPEKSLALVFGGSRFGRLFNDIWAFSLGS